MISSLEAIADLERENQGTEFNSGASILNYQPASWVDHHGYYSFPAYRKGDNLQVSLSLP